MMEQTEQKVLKYQKYLYDIARRIHGIAPENVELADLVQYGQIGLVEALKNYDASKGITFKAFAYARIKGAIYDGLKIATEQTHTRHYRNKFRQACADIAFAEELGLTCESMHDEINRLKNILWMLTHVYIISLDSMSEIGVDDSPERHAIENQYRDFLQESLARLSPKEYQIIYLYYYCGYSLSRAGAMMGVTRSWASRLHARAISQLQKEMSKFF